MVLRTTNDDDFILCGDNSFVVIIFFFSNSQNHELSFKLFFWGLNQLLFLPK
jgi:hypothetical protein